MITYLEQLQRRADELGVSLDGACALEGIAPSTLMRWRRGLFSCRQETAQKIFDRMEIMAGNPEHPVNGDAGCHANSNASMTDGTGDAA